MADPHTTTRDPIEALHKIRLRLHFMNWPTESYWNAGTDDEPRWRPDWRYESQLIDHVLFGSPISTPEKPTDTIPWNQLPPVAPPGAQPSGGGTSALPIAGRVTQESLAHPGR